MYSGSDFLFKPVFLRGFSGSLHLVLSFVLLISWVCKKFKVGHSEGPKEMFKKRRVCACNLLFLVFLCLV